MDWSVLIKITHLVGTALGVGGATLAEVFYLKCLKDGQVDPTESDLLKTIYLVLRIGLVLLVLSGFGYLVFYRLAGLEMYLYSSRLWAKLTITLTLLLGVAAWQAKLVSAKIGGGLSLASWYAALILGAWRLPASISYWQIMAVYFLLAMAVTVVLALIRKLAGVK
jgi:hypothetical protein